MAECINKNDYEWEVQNMNDLDIDNKVKNVSNILEHTQYGGSIIHCFQDNELFSIVPKL